MIYCSLVFGELSVSYRFILDVFVETKCITICGVFVHMWIYAQCKLFQHAWTSAKSVCLCARARARACMYVCMCVKRFVKTYKSPGDEENLYSFINCRFNKPPSGSV